MTRRRTFFTLLEVVIAMAVFAMVAAALFLFSSNVVNTWQRLRTEKEILNQKMSLDRTIDAVFSNAIPFQWRNTYEETLVEEPFIIATAETLRIATMHPLRNAEEGAIRFCEFSLQDGNLILTYTDRPFNTWEQIPAERIHTTILATNVAAISFQYADWSSDTTLDWNERMFWTTEWETEESDRTDIPLAILLRIRWLDGREESWIRRTMGNGYRERFGTYNPPSTVNQSK